MFICLSLPLHCCQVTLPKTYIYIYICLMFGIFPILPKFSPFFPAILDDIWYSMDPPPYNPALPSQWRPWASPWPCPTSHLATAFCRCFGTPNDRCFRVFSWWIKPTIVGLAEENDSWSTIPMIVYKLLEWIEWSINGWWTGAPTWRLPLSFWDGRLVPSWRRSKGRESFSCYAHQRND